MYAATISGELFDHAGIDTVKMEGRGFHEVYGRPEIMFMREMYFLRLDLDAIEKGIRDNNDDDSYPAMQMTMMWKRFSAQIHVSCRGEKMSGTS